MSYNKETKMYEGYIYIISNIINDKKYIGQTYTTPSVRWSGHKNQVNNHECTDKLHNAMCKYGIENFHYEVLDFLSSETKKDLIFLLNEKEIYYIKKFDSYHNGYNTTKGGRGGAEHHMRSVTQYDLYGNKIQDFESIQDLNQFYDSVSTIYDCCSGNCKYAYGHIWRYSEDNIDKYALPDESEIREAIITERAKNKVKQYTWNGELIAIFDNATMASDETGIKRNIIVNSCSGRNVFGGSYIWRFFEDKFEDLKHTRDKLSAVNQYSLDDQFIRSFISSREAARYNNMSYQTINGVCRKNKKTSGGYKWFYANDETQPDKTRIIS